jgi:GAF domain-containing protein/HAMP domain-containing protein
MANRPHDQPEETSMSDQASTHHPTQLDQPRKPRRRVSITRGIGRTLLISFLGVTLLPLSIVGIISGIQSRASIAESTQASLINVANMRAQTVQDWLKERGLDLQLLRNDNLTETWLQSVLSSSESLVSSDSSTLKAFLLARLQQEVTQGGGFKSLFLLDKRGVSIVSTDPRRLNENMQNQPYALPTSDRPFSVLYYDNLLETDEVAVAQGIFDQNKQLAGVLVGTTDISRLSDLMQAGTRLGQTDESYLVSDDSKGIARFLTTPRNTTAFTATVTGGVATALASSGDRTIQGSYNNYVGMPVYGAYRVLPGLGRVVLVTEQATAEALEPVSAQTRGILSALVLGALTAIAGAYILTRRITRPIDNLTEVAEAVASGDLNQFAEVGRRDQIGVLATSFNTMTARLRDTIDSLETRVEMRTAQVQASADVGRAVTSILDPDQLLKRVVQLITERFGLYYAAAFTLDTAGQWAILREASGPGDAAWLLKKAGHRLDITGTSMVAASIRDRQAHIALDVGTEAIRFSNPLLPETRSEVSLPLIVGDQILGALDVQSTQAAAFDETSTAVLQNMADQIAVALNNAARYQLEHQRTEQTTQLLEASVELSSQTDAASLYNRIVEVAARLLHTDSAALWQPVEEQELELLYAAGPLQALIGRRAPIGEGIAGRVQATSLALRLNDTRTWHDAALDFGEVPVRAVVAVPMIWQGEPVGVLVAAHTHPDSAFSADDGNVAQLFAAQTASMLANMRLLEQLQNTLDDLGAANRRLTGEAWQARLHDREISYAYRRTTASLTDQPAMSLALPIELRGLPIGQIVLDLRDQPQRELTDDERNIVQEVTQRMALALESARLFEQTQAALGEARRLAQREQMVNRITGQLRTATTVDEVLQIATNEIRRAVHASWAAADLEPPTHSRDV